MYAWICPKTAPRHRVLQRIAASLLLAANAAYAADSAASAAAPQVPIAVVRALHGLQAPDEASVKAWPGVADRTLVAWVTWHDEAFIETSESPNALDLDVAVIETSTGRVMHHLHEHDAWKSDAMHFDGFSFDLANYALAPGIRAFGLRSSSHHQGCAGSELEALRLFEIRGGELIRVTTEDLVMKRSTSWCVCQGDQVEQTRTLAIANATSSNQADLVWREKSSIEHDEPDTSAPDGCKNPTEKKTRRVVLHFNGETYPIPSDWR